MGLSTRQACLDSQGEDLDQNLLQSGKTEPPRPLQIRQNKPLSESLKCPRCSSTNTKFCYFNNYNKSQPRHFCKSCKRHWTKGGTLRNVPVGGRRKNKRPKISNTSIIPRTQNCSNFPSGTNTYNTPFISLILPSSPLLHNPTNAVIPKLSMGRKGTNVSTGLNVLETQSQKTESLSSNLNKFETNSCLIVNPTSYEVLNAYDHQYLAPRSLESNMEESITSSTPWPGLDITSTAGIEEYFPSYWNCIWKNEIDQVSTSSDINIVWNLDEIEIKP